MATQKEKAIQFRQLHTGLDMLVILVSPPAPTIPELARLGVARVTFGGGLMRAVLGHLQTIAGELFAGGTFTAMSEHMLAASEFRRLFESSRGPRYCSIVYHFL